jgi:hypothetical protein
VDVVPASSAGGWKETVAEPCAAVTPVIEGAVAVCEVSVGVTGADDADDRLLTPGGVGGHGVDLERVGRPTLTVLMMVVVVPTKARTR